MLIVLGDKRLQSILFAFWSINMLLFDIINMLHNVTYIFFKGDEEMVRKIKKVNNNISEKVIKLESLNQSLLSEITKKNRKIKQLDLVVEKLQNKITKVKLNLDNNFSKKTTRTENKILLIINDFKEKKKKLTVTELSKQTNISRQHLYRKYKHLINNL